MTPAELLATLDALIALGDAATSGPWACEGNVVFQLKDGTMIADLYEIDGKTGFGGNDGLILAAGTHFKGVLKKLKVAVVALQEIGPDQPNDKRWQAVAARKALNSITRTMNKFTLLDRDELGIHERRPDPKQPRGPHGFISRECPDCDNGILQYEGDGIWRCDGLKDPEHENKELETCTYTHIDGDTP